MRRPEELLANCFVDHPDDIDLEVIAFQEGLEVRDETLDGCEASLVGYGNKGIIKVAPGVSPERRRFSIAHEVGHWERHRGQSFSCRVEERALDKAVRSKEREADDYAAELMMPANLFKEAIRSTRRVSHSSSSATCERPSGRASRRRPFGTRNSRASQWC